MIKKLEKSENEQNERLLDLQSRQMRDNLIFYNIPEERLEPDEECTNKLYTFFEEDVKIMNSRLIKLDRVHRLGRYSPMKTRPIIAKFCHYQDREMVGKLAKNLDGTQYSISQQFPKEINARRKSLVLTLKSLKDEGYRAYMYISVDKLQPHQQSSNGGRNQGAARGFGRGQGRGQSRSQGQGQGQGRSRGRGWDNMYPPLSGKNGNEENRSRNSSVESGRLQNGQGHDNGQEKGQGQMETDGHEGKGQGQNADQSGEAQKDNYKSEVQILSRNIKELTNLKQNSADFSKFISQYDIIALYETLQVKNQKSI